MNRHTLLLTLISASILTACAGAPKLFWDTNEGKDKPAYANGSQASAGAAARAPLDVPPDLRKEIEVPMPDKVAADAASQSSGVTPARKQAVAGKAVSLDARRYDFAPAQLFSAVVDAMTALNLPVDSVDSPSGTITTEWIGKDVNTPNTYVTSVLNMFGAATTKVRYRYIVRVLRAGDKSSQLEVRTLGQQYANNHWYNAQLRQKVANDLIGAVEEQLGRLK